MSEITSTYRLDDNHLGIRVAVLAILLFGSLLGFLIIMPVMLGLLNMSGLPELCFSVTGALAIGMGGAWLSENVLKKIWPSGSTLKVSEGQLILEKRRGQQTQLSWSERLNIQAWYFVIRRGRSLVPKGWYCAACRLLQDDEVITVYSFIKPSMMEEFARRDAFEELISQKHAPRRGQEDQLRRVGEQKQMRAAERERWESGVEMQPEDFFNLVETISTKLDYWPGTSTNGVK